MKNRTSSSQISTLMSTEVSRTFTRKITIPGIALLIAVAAVGVNACKPAGYQVNQPGQTSQNNFNPSQANLPSARVEVIDQGVSVTWTIAGNKVDIRPSADTLAPDFVGKDSCPNPGLIEADYDLANGNKPAIQRSQCSSLASTAQIFNTPGDYLIKMTVKTKDNQQALASMVLRVLDKSTTTANLEGGFTIHGKPMIAAVNTPITFTGICELKGRLNTNWDYGDSATGSGAVTQHTYSKTGQFLVNSTCTSDSGKKDTASITVVVMNTVPGSIPTVAVPVPSSNPNANRPVPTTPIKTGCDPTQGPCQSTTQTPIGSTQTVPNTQTGPTTLPSQPIPTDPGTTLPVLLPTDSSQVWYYDPSCGCYYQFLN